MRILAGAMFAAIVAVAIAVLTGVGPVFDQLATVVAGL